MNVQTGKYYWPTTFLDAPSYPSLKESLTCDVLIVGGGSSAAQCAYYLADTGFNVVVIEKGHVGHGSTKSNTALIQYSGEKMFTDLIHTFGEAYIGRHLQLLRQAINDIEKAAKAADIDSEFMRRDTLYAASCQEDIVRLRQEYELLVKHGFELSFWTKADIERNYPFSRDAAIYSYGDGELNPYRFTHALFDYAAKRNIRIFENTEMNGHHFDPNTNLMHVSAKGGYTVSARKVIIAAGYEGMDIRKEKMVSFVSTYNVITNPVDDFSAWHNRTLLWETGNKLFPDIRVEPEYYLTAFYGSTRDGLPIIGVYEEYPHCYFLFGFGDNGTVYSQMLAKMIVDDIVAGSSPDLALYLHHRPLLTVPAASS